jgi:hypothetical protein
MKKLLAVAVLAMATAGCQDLTISKAPDGVLTGHLQSFGRKSSIEEITVNSNGVWTLRGYNNDEVTLPLAAFQALQSAAMKAAVAP